MAKRSYRKRKDRPRHRSRNAQWRKFVKTCRRCDSKALKFLEPGKVACTECGEINEYTTQD